jgi:deoxyadenosine/deoxycytidine kinase
MTRDSGYVIIEGNIGVGKSTFARLLADALRARGVRAEYLPEPDETTNPFLADYYADPAGNAYKMQMHLLHQRFKSTRYAQAAALAGKGWYILDRSYYGDICFANVQVADGYFKPAEIQSYLDAHRNMREFIEPPTCAIFLKATPETCLRRIGVRNRNCEAGIPLSYLRALDKEIKSLAGTLVGRCNVWQYAWDVDRNETEQWNRAGEIAGELLGLKREDWDF